MNRIIFRRVHGEPIPQKRHRHTGAGKFVRTYDPSAKDKENFLKKTLEGGQMKQLEGPLKLIVTFAFSRPKSHLKKGGDLRKGAPVDKTSKPDLDNLVKFVKDALNGVAFKDDSQITEIDARKEYGEARTDVTIQEL